MKLRSAIILGISLGLLTTALGQIRPQNANQKRWIGASRVIQVIAGSDHSFKVPGETKAVLIVKANDVMKLRINSRRGTEMDSDGTVHSFTINALKDRGWDLRLKEGTQEFTLVAPSEPGEYIIECSVFRGQGHEDMRMKLVVLP